jgi:hypothetical protein
VFSVLCAGLGNTACPNLFHGLSLGLQEGEGRLSPPLLSPLGRVLRPVVDRSGRRVALHQVDGVPSTCLALVHLRPPDDLAVIAPEVRPDSSGRGVDAESSDGIIRPV